MSIEIYYYRSFQVIKYDCLGTIRCRYLISNGTILVEVRDQHLYYFGGGTCAEFCTSLVKVRLFVFEFKYGRCCSRIGSITVISMTKSPRWGRDRA